VAADVAELALAVVLYGEPRIRPDAVAAATLAAAVARAAVAIVEANLTALEGDTRVTEAEELAGVAAYAAKKAQAAIA
jgi:formiminotetrahydrofolate cyclodeaminase